MKIALRTIALCLAAVLLGVAAPAAFAETPSAEDQYLEVVPGADGNQSPEEFSRSLGGDGGPVTREQIVKLARRNAAKLEREAAGTGDGSRGGDLIASRSQEARGNVAAFTHAATGGSLGGNFAFTLVVALALTAGLGLAMRRRATA